MIINKGAGAVGVGERTKRSQRLREKRKEMRRYEWLLGGLMVVLLVAGGFVLHHHFDWSVFGLFPTDAPPSEQQLKKEAKKQSEREYQLKHRKDYDKKLKQATDYANNLLHERQEVGAQKLTDDGGFVDADDPQNYYADYLLIDSFDCTLDAVSVYVTEEFPESDESRRQKTVNLAQEVGTEAIYLFLDDAKEPASRGRYTEIFLEKELLGHSDKVDPHQIIWQEN